MKKAFTLIELIFIIVIIGILLSTAIPRLAGTRDDALISKNSEYIVGIMTEISTYITARGESKNDLSEMSFILSILKSEDRVVIDTADKSAEVKIGEDTACITIDIDSTSTTELLKTVFSIDTSDRVCKMVQSFIREKDYPLVVRGRLIRY